MENDQFLIKYPNKYDDESRTPLKETPLWFGYFDSKGREIGMVAQTWEIEIIPATEQDRFGRTNKAIGHYYVARAQELRGKLKFGPSQSERYFFTREERDLYLAKRWEDSLKNAPKKAAK